MSDLDAAAIFGALAAARVDYVTVGGWAVIAHGVVRATVDVDVIPSPEPQNLERLAAALRGLGARPHGEPDAEIDAGLLGRRANMRFETDAGLLDLLCAEQYRRLYPDLASRAVPSSWGMHKILGLALLSLMLVPAAASAATVDADVKRRNGVRIGPVTFTAAPGEVNRLTVSIDRDGFLLFRDRANRVKAKGDCEQVDRHAARCTWTEDIAQARLGDRGDRGDRAQVNTELVEVLGGSGNDVLEGFRGRNTLSGDRGHDTLRGGGGVDHLTGGPGRDRVFGGNGDDTLIDGESNRQSARDLYRGGDSRDTIGADRGDVIDYSRRTRSVRVDLGRGRNNTRDRILGLESVVGGSGDDRLIGDGDDNNLEGGTGDDFLRGRGGADIPLSGKGNDNAAGGGGNDVVWGHGGRDKLAGGSGDDSLISRDGNAERVSCGNGSDDVSMNRTDTVTTCEAQPATARSCARGSPAAP